MIKKRKHHSEEFKAKVALEALREQKTIVQIAQENELHPNQVIKWRKQLQEGASQIFEDGRTKPREREVSQEKLFQQIGQLQYELSRLKKNLGSMTDQKREQIESQEGRISVTRQCTLIDLARSKYYYKAKPESELNLSIMRMIDQIYTDKPFYGARKIREAIGRHGIGVNIKRIRRLMQNMGLQAIYCKPKLSKAVEGHEKHPYLLRDVKIDHCNQVWSTDITYIPMQMGYMYLTAVIDWFSRYVLSWRISNSLDGSFCRQAIIDALSIGKPLIFNTDQGCQFTCRKFLKILKDSKIKISMDGRGRALDNIFVERSWRSVKYEYIYLNPSASVKELYNGLKCYFDFYNHKRLHQALDYSTPSEIYFSGKHQAVIELNIDNQ